MYYKVTNGSVTIDAKTILEEINIEIKEKDKIAIIGRNGAGKTTLLKALISNDMLSEGVAEEKFSIFKSGINSIGYLRQENLNISNTLLDEILLVYKPLIEIGIKLKKLEEEMELGSNSEASYKYTELLDKYKILGGYQYKKEYTTALIKFGFSEEDKTKLLSSFSGGERTKIALLKLLLSKPDLLFLDEPTNHLDIGYQIQLMDLIKSLNITTLSAIHDMNIASMYCDYLIIMKNGQIKDFGKVEDVITSEMLKEIFGVNAYVGINPINNKLQVSFMHSHEHINGVGHDHIHEDGFTGKHTHYHYNNKYSY